MPETGAMRALRDLGPGQARYTIRLDLAADGTPAICLGEVSIPGSERVSVEAINARLEALLGLITGKGLPAWLVSAVVTEANLWRAELEGRMAQQAALDGLGPTASAARSAGGASALPSSAWTS